MRRPEEVRVRELHQLEVLDDALVHVPLDVDRVRSLVHRDLVDLVAQREVQHRLRGGILRRRYLVRHDVLIVLRLPLARDLLEQRGGVVVVVVLVVDQRQRVVVLEVVQQQLGVRRPVVRRQRQDGRLAQRLPVGSQRIVQVVQRGVEVAEQVAPA